MIGRVLGALVAGTASMVVLLPPATAAVSGDPVQLSSDGTHWGDSLARPLFDPDVLWVPGDVREASFYVGNHGPTPAAVRLLVRASADSLVAPGDVAFDARVAGGPWLPVGPRAGTSALNEVAVPVSAQEQVHVRAAFRRGSRNTSQSSAVHLGFTVALQQAASAPPDSLPATGSPRLGLPVLLGAVFLGAGAALLRRAARRG